MLGTTSQIVKIMYVKQIHCPLTSLDYSVSYRIRWKTLKRVDILECPCERETAGDSGTSLYNWEHQKVVNICLNGMTSDCWLGQNVVHKEEKV